MNSLHILAAAGQDKVNDITKNLVGGTDLWSLLMSALNWAIGLIALVAVVMLIWNGVQYITAGGDEGKVEKATKGITNAIIGLVICFISGLIVNFVISQLTGGFKAGA